MFLIELYRKNNDSSVVVIIYNINYILRGNWRPWF